MNDIAIIIPYYNQPEMLKKQFKFIQDYPDNVQVLIIDDGSTKTTAHSVATPDRLLNGNLKCIEIFEIIDDIPWNRNGARNLGALLAESKWIIQIDIDHVLPATDLNKLLHKDLDEKSWYRFPRVRIGEADETRKKDLIDPNAKHGEIKPHIDSYLMIREQYLSSPYDERYRGFLGGGSPFLARQKRLYGDAKILDGVYLWVYTRHKVPDASVTELSRDTSIYKAKRREIEAAGDDTPIKPFNFNWRRVL